MPLTAAQICTLAMQDAKCPGFTSQAGQLLNATLQDMCQDYDLDAALNTFNFSFNSVTGQGSGPYTLPVDYLRTQVQDGKDTFLYTINGVPYPLIQITLAEYEWMVQTPGFSSYPYNYSTDLSKSPPQLFIWPPASGAYVATMRYYRLMPDIVTPESSATVPWFTNTQILIRSLAGRLMGLTGDDRMSSYLGDDEEKYPMGAGTLMKKYLKNIEDREGAVHTVGRDRRRWGRPFDQLKNTKNIGWVVAALMLMGAWLAPQPASATCTAPCTAAQMATDITTNFPDNAAGLITPAITRGFYNNVINSIMPTAPVVNGNLACYNGTTGLLKDCGTTINSGVANQVAYYATTGGPLASSPYLLQGASPLGAGLTGITVLPNPATNINNAVSIVPGTGNRSGFVTFWSQDGTTGAPAALGINEEIGGLQFLGWNGAAFGPPGTNTEYLAITTEAWDSTHNGSAALIQATPNGTTAAQGEACFANGMTAINSGGSCPQGMGWGTINAKAGVFDNGNRVFSAISAGVIFADNAEHDATIQNTNVGTGVLSSWSAINNLGTAIFGVAGSGYTGSANLTNKAVVLSSSGLAGIAISTAGAKPIDFYVNSTRAGGFSTSGVWDFVNPPSFVGTNITGTAASLTAGTFTAGSATNLTSGTLAAARGGAGTITGALKGNGAGVVAQAASTDLSDATAATTWTPSDASGAGLSFTGVSGNFSKLNKTCSGNFRVTFPSTVSAAPVSINLPCTAANNGNQAMGTCFTGAATPNSILSILGIANTITTAFLNLTGSLTQTTNANLSTVVLSCNFNFITT